MHAAARQIEVQCTEIGGIVRHCDAGLLGTHFHCIEDFAIHRFSSGCIDENKNEQQEHNAQDRHGQLQRARIGQPPPESAPEIGQHKLHPRRFPVGGQLLDFAPAGRRAPGFPLAGQALRSLLPHQLREPQQGRQITCTLRVPLQACLNGLASANASQ